MINVNGLTIEDILNMSSDSLRKLNAKDYKALTNRLVSAGNKRLRRFEKRGEEPRPYTRVMETGGHFSVKGLTKRSDIVKEFTRARAFLQSKTSTVRGYNDVLNKIAEGFKNAKGGKSVKISKKKLKQFLKAFDKAKESNPLLAKREYVYKVANKVNEMMSDDRITDDKVDEIAIKVTEEMGRYIEDVGGRDIGSNARFFDDGENL